MYHVLYELRVNPEMEREFLQAWSHFTLEIREQFKAYGANLLKSEGEYYYIYGVWPSKEVWEKFWLTKEIKMEALTRMKSCLLEPSKPIPVKLVFSSLDITPAKDLKDFSENLTQVVDSEDDTTKLTKVDELSVSLPEEILSEMEDIEEE